MTSKNKKARKHLLYTKMKVFHFKDKLDSLLPDTDRITAPLHIRIKPTNVCNHNCRYCAYKVGNLQLGKDMIARDQIPIEKMMEIIEDIIEMGVKSVTFSGGGEPFCYPHLLEAVKKLSLSPVKFAALTNGALLEGEIASIFADHATWVRVSIDGWDDESYSRYRNVGKGEFARVMRNMENFKKIGGKCFLGVSIIVDKENANHIYELIKELKEKGADSVKISPCIISNDASENNAYHKRVFDTVKDEIKRSTEEFQNEDFEINDSYHALDEKFRKDYTWCPYLQILPVIGADLNIYPCQDKAYNFDEGLVGSIRSERFKDFWFSDKNKFYKINPSTHCNHHCVANAKNKLVLEYLNTDRDHMEFV